MDPFASARRRRRRRPPASHARTARRPRHASGLAAPRPAWWWKAAGALWLLLLLPLAAGAQGLRSTTLSISLSATRLPEAPRVARDLSWEPGGEDSVGGTLHLVEGPAGIPLHVRGTDGRLHTLGAAGVPVAAGRVSFRVVADSAGTPGVTWHVVLRRSLDGRPSATHGIVRR